MQIGTKLPVLCDYAKVLLSTYSGCADTGNLPAYFPRAAAEALHPCVQFFSWYYLTISVTNIQNRSFPLCGQSEYGQRQMNYVHTHCSLRLRLLLCHAYCLGTLTMSYYCNALMVEFLHAINTISLFCLRRVSNCQYSLVRPHSPRPRHLVYLN